MVLSFPVIFCIPEVNDSHCIKNMHEPWGFVSTAQRGNTSRERRCH